MKKLWSKTVLEIRVENLFHIWIFTLSFARALLLLHPTIVSALRTLEIVFANMAQVKSSLV